MLDALKEILDLFGGIEIYGVLGKREKQIVDVTCTLIDVDGM
jgi:hypothetical protein